MDSQNFNEIKFHCAILPPSPTPQKRKKMISNKKKIIILDAEGLIEF